MRIRQIGAGLAFFLCAALSSTIHGQSQEESREDRIERLEAMVNALTEEVKSLRAELESEKAEQVQHREAVSEQLESVRAEAAETEGGFDLGGFQIGGYGESHFNFIQGDDRDQADIHRFVLDFGYDFADWITFRSEVEIEHGLIKDGDGEIVVEQFYVDLLLSEHANVRLGRFLTPVGLINRFHEPTRFNGVERPGFASSIIPSTWFSDGVGLYGKLIDSVSYELYLANGLDGSGFSALNGIRGGRLQERPSLNDLAVTGRVDFYPFVHLPAPHGQTLRLGLGGWHGGLDNGDEGVNPGLSGPDLTLVAADFEYSIDRFDLRGEGAIGYIDEADELGAGVAEQIAGWYLEPSVHVFPESWKKGKLKRADAVIFARYEEYDTQHKTQSGLARVPGGDREALTTGINFYLTPSVVLKADYQFLDSDALSDPADRWNLGVGMQF